MVQFSYLTTKVTLKGFLTMDFTTSVRLFHLLLAPLLNILPKAVTTHRADWRCHKFKATHHVLLSLFALPN